MDPKELQELKELIEFLKANEIAEFDLEKDALKVRLKFLGAVKAEAPAAGGVDLATLTRLLGSAPAPVAAAAAAQVAQVHGVAEATASPVAAAAAAETLHVVKCPLVGTFYESPSPGSPSFVKVGDVVEVGQVLCIVEAMKLMNEVEADAAGEIVERVVKTGQPVEFGQALFKIRAQ
jgi:acetyl-CoA carboxylase biotin carboxyl carrier protein